MKKLALVLIAMSSLSLLSGWVAYPVSKQNHGKYQRDHEYNRGVRPYQRDNDHDDGVPNRQDNRPNDANRY